MIDWLLEKLANLLDAKPKPPAVIDWRSLVAEVQPHIGNWRIFLVTRAGKFIRLDAPEVAAHDNDIASIAVAYWTDDVKHSEAEVAVKHMASVLESALQRKVFYLINRDPDAFIGWFVSVSAPAT